MQGKKGVTESHLAIQRHQSLNVYMKSQTRSTFLARVVNSRSSFSG